MIESGVDNRGDHTMAKAYYYTRTEEAHPVYHDNQDCEEGKKIEAGNRVDTDVKPAGRDHCEVC
jgi:hypothetical protein